MNECVCAITGHRPSRFKFKYSEDYALCKKIKANMLEVFRKLHDEKEVRRFYVGGALGVDMWAAEQILRLKEQPGYEDIELVVPCRLSAMMPSGISAARAGWSSSCNIAAEKKSSETRIAARAISSGIATWWIRPTTWWQFMTMNETCDPAQCNVSGMHEKNRSP